LGLRGAFGSSGVFAIIQIWSRSYDWKRAEHDSAQSFVMRGQKRVEDARKRAYYPRIHLLTKKDGLPGQARQ
jgi:hypothetical protein